MVGISVIEQGSFVADRYRVAERLTRFAIADSTLTGVEYEYWLALDETRGVEVWLQVAESRGVIASGAELAGVVSALRRLNHPALPAVLDFGEIEVEVEADAEEEDDGETVVAAVGYVVLEPVEAENLATVLLRGALTEAEILAMLVEIADVLKVLHEVELVHGHLSAYSFLLAEHGVLLIDLAAALALETASGSELTAGADVYALAWLACVALAGVEAVEAEFGVGFDAGSSPESLAAPQLLTIDLIERRRAWAEANLVATYGLRAELAALLIAALGEAGGRPTVAALAAALRVREDVVEVSGAAQLGAVAAGAAAVLAAEEVVEAVEAEIVEEVEVTQAAEMAAAGVVEAEEVEVAEVVESASVSESAGAFVGAGVGAAVAMGVEASGGAARGGAGAGGGAGTGTAFASAPVVPPAPPAAGRHGSPPRRPRSAVYVAIAIVVLIIVAIAWGCSVGGSSPSGSPSGAPTTGGQASGGQSAPAVVPSASGGQSATASAGAGGGASATATSTAGGGGQASASATPGYTATPLGTAPASPGQALQQIQQTVSGAESAGQLPEQAKGPLGQAIGTLQQEISGNSSVQQGISQLRSALKTPGVPSGFVSQINELIPYLVARQGS